ncbi:MAG: hypothetical protein JWN73_4675 [Betaproteobacteria bacterium]|nr:hypothetical protein [Betaproteobacteria bacterium]
MIFGLTQLGVLHTIISLVAVFAGLVVLVRDGQITPYNTLGQVYIWATVLTCVTGFGIFQHGGFGKPHALGIITLVTLGVAALAGRTALFGKLSVYVETASYSATFLFHWIPAVTETTTRLPLGAPLLPNADTPELKAATGVLLLLFLIGAGWQVWRIRRHSTAPTVVVLADEGALG